MAITNFLFAVAALLLLLFALIAAVRVGNRMLRDRALRRDYRPTARGRRRALSAGEGAAAANIARSAAARRRLIELMEKRSAPESPTDAPSATPSPVRRVFPFRVQGRDGR
jgi:hypothetical protein